MLSKNEEPIRNCGGCGEPCVTETMGVYNCDGEMCPYIHYHWICGLCREIFCKTKVIYRTKWGCLTGDYPALRLRECPSKELVIAAVLESS